MKKREWLLVILPLLATWTLDRITKLWATTLVQVKPAGLFTFTLVHNQGAMLGLFSELPALLRIVSLSTTGAFLLCTYALIQYLLPVKSLTLRAGLSFLIGGIMGNVTDRIVWGYVVDFIVVGYGTVHSPVFNVADALQWVGYALIVYAIIKEGDVLWPEHNIRTRYWVNMSFQVKYCLMLMGVGLSLAIICLVFSYTYLRVTIHELVGNNSFLLDKFLIPYVITFIVISIAFCAILFSVGRVISHRIAGPLYAFERFLNDVLDDKPATLKLRAGDEFRHLEDLSREVQRRLNAIKQERTVNVIEYKEDENQ